MGAKTKIEWTDATWTPIRARAPEIQTDGSVTERVGWHCEHVSEGCRFCYAERINQRLGTGRAFQPQQLRLKSGSEGGMGVEIFLDDDMLRAPIGWRKSRSVFACSMTDLFAAFAPDWMIDRVFAVMAIAGLHESRGPHTFQVLTKRPERMRAYLTAPDVRERIAKAAGNLMEDGDAWHDAVRYGPWPLPNVWLLTSAEDQPTANERVPHLLMTPAAVRGVSLEPLLGPIDLTAIDVDGDNMLDGLSPYTWQQAWADWRETEPTLAEARESFCDWYGIAEWDGDECPRRGPMHSRLDWVIVGGESGGKARLMHPDWARSLRDQCAGASGRAAPLSASEDSGVAFFFKQWGEWAPAPPGLELADTRWISSSGQLAGCSTDGRSHKPDPSAMRMARVGKKAAGRRLDGVLHDARPPVPAIEAAA